MLSPAEHEVVLAAVQLWAAAAPDEPVMGFVDRDGFLTASELAAGIRDHTEDGETFLQMIEHAVHQDGIESVIRRFTAAASSTASA